MDAIWNGPLSWAHTSARKASGIPHADAPSLRLIGGGALLRTLAGHLLYLLTQPIKVQGKAAGDFEPLRIAPCPFPVTLQDRPVPRGSVYEWVPHC
jgi:hypothetical protein